jgi:hypothetical protein
MCMYTQTQPLNVNILSEPAMICLYDCVFLLVFGKMISADSTKLKHHYDSRQVFLRQVWETLYMEWSKTSTKLSSQNKLELAQRNKRKQINSIKSALIVVILFFLCFLLYPPMEVAWNFNMINMQPFYFSLICFVLHHRCSLNMSFSLSYMVYQVSVISSSLSRESHFCLIV